VVSLARSARLAVLAPLAGAVAWAGCNQILGNDGNDQLTAAASGGGTTGTGPVTSTSGSSSSGMAAPVVFYRSGNNGTEYWGITLFAGYVYWTDKGSGDVLRMLADADGGMEMLAKDDSSPQGLAVTTTDVYWTTPTHVRAASVIAPFFPRDFASGDDTQYVVAPSNTGDIYWTNRGPATPSMEMAPITDGDAGTMFAQGGPGANDIATDGSTVFWTTSTGIWMLRQAGTPTLLHADKSSPNAIAANTTRVYWTDPDCLVQSVAFDGGGLAVLGSNGGQDCNGIAADVADVYWADTTMGRILRAPADADGGTQTQIVAEGQSGPERIAIGVDYVYWTNSASGTIMKLAR
jgi:hypothetical protein